MPSKSNKDSCSERSNPEAAQLLLAPLRFLVATWRGYIELQTWAIAVSAVILVATGNVFTVAGLVLAGGVALTILLYYLDRWLKTH